MIVVEAADPRDAAPAALLAQAQAFQAQIYADEHNHSLPINALAADDVRFFAAREGEALLGVGALKLCGDYGEVKSMFTADAGRGKGIAAAILRMLEDTARDEGLAWLKLETGDELDAACRLYERHGFARCGAFGGYADNGVSVFYEKPLG
ncbi:GNAT family N-acetyltransferase [Celeribacter arenosi]|uniref:GNAT family N-acetyltransferase n=1 Tax=Celeribacter arenosi TaxID=792649 RepID=A0ABP7JZD0_9RHOB